MWIIVTLIGISRMCYHSSQGEDTIGNSQQRPKIEQNKEAIHVLG